MIRSAARRASLPVFLLGGAVAVVAAIGLLTGTPLQRSVSLGLYAVGSFMVLVGFGLGTRNSFRSSRRHGLGESGAPPDLWETTEAAALLIVIGLVLLGVGIAVDARVRLI